MFRLVLVLSIFTVIASGLKLPSVPQLLDGRIVGGKDANIADFPYQISLRFKSYIGNTYSHGCGGSLYSARVIVTAAHCVSGEKAANVRVTVGSGSLQDANGSQLEVDQLIAHPEYNRNTIDNDVALIILKNKVSFGVNVQPIALAESKPPGGALAVVSGWGYTKEGGRISDQLQSVEVDIVNNESCGKSYSGMPITENMICAGVENGGKDACQGDSGGPLVSNNKLVGIVSWGMGCARPDYPGVYSDVAALRSWIVANAAPYL